MVRKELNPLERQSVAIGQANGGGFFTRVLRKHRRASQRTVRGWGWGWWGEECHNV